jgi:hypothetical protein
MTQARQEQRLNSFLTAENLSTVDEDRFANPPPLASIFKRNDTRHVVVHAHTGRIPPYRYRFAPLTLLRLPAFDLVVNREGLKEHRAKWIPSPKSYPTSTRDALQPSIAQQHLLLPSGGLVATFLAIAA